MKNQKRPPIFRDLIEVLAGFAVFGILLAAFLFTVKTCAKEVLDVAGRMAAAERGDASESHEEAVLEAERYMARSSTGVGRVSKALWVYTEGDGPAPEWYDPDEPMAVEWEASDQQITEPNEEAVSENIGVFCGEAKQVKTDIGCSDPWFDSPIYGWDGHTMTGVELDLFSMIFYREFWQPNLTLCEAGCDAMLQLWDLNGGTMYETLSHVNEDGSYAFSTYPGVWETEYDPDGLAWCRAYCEERFYEGPSWPAQYFRKGQYHDWDEWSPIPAYEIDGIYFSIGKEG